MIAYSGPIFRNALLKTFNSCLNHGIWPWNLIKVIFINNEGKKDFTCPSSYLIFQSFLSLFFINVSLNLRNHMVLLNTHKMVLFLVGVPVDISLTLFLFFITIMVIIITQTPSYWILVKVDYLINRK